MEKLLTVVREQPELPQSTVMALEMMVFKLLSSVITFSLAMIADTYLFWSAIFKNEHISVNFADIFVLFSGTLETVLYIRKCEK